MTTRNATTITVLSVTPSTTTDHPGAVDAVIEIALYRTRCGDDELDPCPGAGCTRCDGSGVHVWQRADPETCEVTLLPAQDGRARLETWGPGWDCWADATTIDQLEAAVDPHDLVSTIEDAVTEAAEAAGLGGRPPLP